MALTIQQDSREVVGKHDEVEKYFLDNDIKILRSKLPFGDYALLTDYTLVVDYKANVMEIAGNLTHEHARFKREILGANENGIGLVVLIVEEEQYTLDNLAEKYAIPRYKSDGWGKDKVTGKKVRTHYKGQPMAQFNVATLVKIMKTMQEKYGVLFMFTTKEKCGKDIIDILYNNREYYKEYFSKKLGG